MTYAKYTFGIDSAQDAGRHSFLPHPQSIHPSSALGSCWCVGCCMVITYHCFHAPRLWREGTSGTCLYRQWSQCSRSLNPHRAGAKTNHQKFSVICFFCVRYISSHWVNEVTVKWPNSSLANVQAVEWNSRGKLMTEMSWNPFFPSPQMGGWEQCFCWSHGTWKIVTLTLVILQTPSEQATFYFGFESYLCCIFK